MSERFVRWILVSILAFPALAFAEDAAKVTAIWGNVQINGKAAVIDSLISENTSIKTGSDGYIYLKTMDDGLLIVRPNSEARIVSYHVDKQDPSNTRIKLELISGVARSVSGSAVKLARQNFRFNTPVAAIGVRGTDFIVSTTQDVTRVVVLEGGVVVSGFDGACSPQGGGPCEGLSATELFARQQGLLLQINKGQSKPQLLQSAPSISPDSVVPPRPDEPGNKAASVNSSSNVPAVSDPNLDPNKAGSVKQSLASNGNKPSTGIDAGAGAGTSTGTNTGSGTGTGTGTGSGASGGQAPLVNTIIWGRYYELFGQKADFDISKQNDSSTRFMNIYYGVNQVKNTEWQIPTTGSMGFALNDSLALMKDNVKNLETPAKLENGKLQLDFAKATFTTGFDVIAGSEKFALRGEGSVTSNGVLFGANQYLPTANMSVQGVVTAEKGGTAAYVFQSKLDEDGKRMIYGVTYWNKK
ncbi:FecR family protein [Undibacterium sp. Di27W]|uniref:FecR family protein n=1 Tax=Undibacterium sp. Di27W TaxID=3413036 RepID=UPI003BF15EC0